MSAPSNRGEVRDFLVSRRAKVTPQQAGLPVYGANRRVAGLRREEVAMLAGVSADYYTKLERGNLSGVSDSVLDAVAAALQLDEAERTHLFDLAKAAGPDSRRRAAPSRSGARNAVRPGVERILDGITAPAYVRNARFDVLSLNRLGRALFDDALHGGETFNLARYLFLDPGSRDFYCEWPTVARDSVSSLRIAAGQQPFDRSMTDLVGELVTRSDEFAQWWATHDVKLHRTATKRMVHGVIGEIELTGEALVLPGDEGLTIITYTVEPASPSAEALAFLDRWAPEVIRPTSASTRARE